MFPPFIEFCWYSYGSEKANTFRSVQKDLGLMYVHVVHPLQNVRWIMIMNSTHSHMVVSWNRGTFKSSILMKFSTINQPFWYPHLWNPPYLFPVPKFWGAVVPASMPSGKEPTKILRGASHRTAGSMAEKLVLHTCSGSRYESLGLLLPSYYQIIRLSSSSSSSLLYRHISPPRLWRYHKYHPAWNSSGLCRCLWGSSWSRASRHAWTDPWDPLGLQGFGTRCHQCAGNHTMPSSSQTNSPHKLHPRVHHQISSDPVAVTPKCSPSLSPFHLGSWPASHRRDASTPETSVWYQFLL